MRCGALLLVLAACTTPGPPPAKTVYDDADFAEPYEPGPRPVFYVGRVEPRRADEPPPCPMTKLSGQSWPLLVLYDDGLVIRSIRPREDSPDREYATYRLSDAAVEALLKRLPGDGDLSTYRPSYGTTKEAKVLFRYISWETGKR